ncbi:MAG: hypothetical protein ACRCSG_09110 [Cellulosilyticaceae bacterium]
MDHLFSRPPMLVSFGHIYEQNIASKLREIDVFLKSTDCPYSVQNIAELLGMPIKEILDIMDTRNITQINKLDFFTIVSHSSSYICKLIQRQWKYVNTPFYTAEIISYIYELNPDKVQQAFTSLGKEYISESELLDLFNNIFTPIFRM